MKVITNAVPVIKLVPRIYPALSDTIVLQFDNDISIDFEWVLQKNTIVITLLDTSLFKQQEYYPFTLLIGTEIIYKGSIVFLKDGTDVQNYTNQSQDTKRWQ